MFCSKCGNQIADNANFCCSCGSPVSKSGPVTDAYQPEVEFGGGTVTSAVSTRAVVYNSSNEPIKSGVNIVYPDGHSEIGDLYIYETEMVFIKKSKGIYLAFGLPGRALDKGEQKLCFNISDIAHGKRTRIGINPNVYQITLTSGAVYKLCLDKPKVVTYLERIFG